jgi:membrane-bound inhibitor of C-type lysozyme
MTRGIHSTRILRDRLIALLILIGSASCASVTAPAASVVGSGEFVSDSGQTIRADYRDNRTVTLTFTDGTTRVLSQAVSGSGARYVSGPYEWWEHQGEARYSVNEKPVFVGKRKPKPGA